MYINFLTHCNTKTIRNVNKFSHKILHDTRKISRTVSLTREGNIRSKRGFTFHVTHTERKRFYVCNNTKNDRSLQNEKANSTWCPQAVTHPSANQAQRCLTSMIYAVVIWFDNG